MSRPQPQLVVTRTRAERGNRADEERVKTAFRGRWRLPRKALLAELQAGGWDDLTDDRLRLICRYSRGEICASSSCGVMLTRVAPTIYVNRAISEHLSRARESKARATEIQSVLNGAPRSLRMNDASHGPENVSGGAA